MPSKKITPKPTPKVLTPKPYGIKEFLGQMDEHGTTPLHFLIFNNPVDVLREVKTSVETYNRNILRSNDFGQTPYNVALEMSHDPEVNNEDVVRYMTSLLPEGSKQQQPCIDSSDEVPFKGTTTTIREWQHDVKIARQKNLEKLESQQCVPINERESSIFHAFSPVVDLFIKPLGIKFETNDMQYLIPGVIIDRQTNKEYNGFFKYIINKHLLYYRYFVKYPQAWIVLDPKSGKQMPEVKKTVYSLKKPLEKKPSEFYKLPTKQVQEKLDSAQDLDICASYQGLPAIKIYDPVNDIIIYLLRFNSAQPTFPEISAEKLKSLRKQLAESVEKNFTSDDKERMSIINSLLDEGVDINVSIETGSRTALTKAIKELDNPDVIELLIKKGAWVNPKTDNDKYHPLVQAATHAKPSFVKLLLDYGAKVDSKNVIQFTPLMAAVYYAKNNDPHKVKEVVKMLLDHGADLSFTDKFGNTVFELTTDKELLDLLEQYKPEGFKPKPFTPKEKKEPVIEEQPKKIPTEKPGLKITSQEFVPSKPMLKKEK